MILGSLSVKTYTVAIAPTVILDRSYGQITCSLPRAYRGDTYGTVVVTVAAVTVTAATVVDEVIGEMDGA